MHTIAYEIRQHHENIAARFGFGKGHHFADFDTSEVATRCIRCGMEGVELDAPCPNPLPEK